MNITVQESNLQYACLDNAPLSIIRMYGCGHFINNIYTWMFGV